MVRCRGTLSVILSFVFVVSLMKAALGQELQPNADCKPCQGRTGCWYPLDPFGKASKEPTAKCEDCDSDGKPKKGVCNLPMPPPGTDSLAYCLLEFLGCKPQTYFETASTTGYTTVKVSLKRRVTFDQFNTSPVLYSPGAQDLGSSPGSSAVPFYGSTDYSDPWDLYGADQSKWYFQLHVPWSDDYHPDASEWTGKTVWGEEWQVTSSVYWHGPLEAVSHRGLSASITWAKEMPELEPGPRGWYGFDPTKARFSIVSDSHVKYNFSYGTSGSGSSAQPNDGPSEVLLSVSDDGGSTYHPYAKTTMDYYDGSDSGGTIGSLKSATLWRYDGSTSPYPTNPGDWTWKKISQTYQRNGTEINSTTHTYPGEPICELNNDDIIRMQSTTSTAIDSISTSDLSDYASRVYNYDSAGYLVSVSRGCRSCGQ